MEWFNRWGSEEWSAIGAVISASIALAALVHAWKTNRDSEQRQEEMASLAARSASAAEGSMDAAKRSAVASEDSAEATKDSVKLQRQQWEESRSADLRLLSYDFSFPSVGSVDPNAIALQIRNVGQAHAYQVRGFLKFPGELETAVGELLNEVAPQVTKGVGFHLEKLDSTAGGTLISKRLFPEIFKAGLTYYDHSAHRIEFLFQTAETAPYRAGVNQSPTLLGAQVDSRAHPNHPIDSTTDKIDVLPIPDDL